MNITALHLYLGMRAIIVLKEIESHNYIGDNIPLRRLNKSQSFLGINVLAAFTIMKLFSLHDYSRSLRNRGHMVKLQYSVKNGINTSEIFVLRDSMCKRADVGERGRSRERKS